MQTHAALVVALLLVPGLTGPGVAKGQHLDLKLIRNIRSARRAVTEHAGRFWILTPALPDISVRRTKDPMSVKDTPADVHIVDLTPLPMASLLYPHEPRGHMPKLLAGLAAYHPKGIEHIRAAQTAPKGLEVYLVAHDATRANAEFDLPHHGVRVRALDPTLPKRPAVILTDTLPVILHRVPAGGREAAELLQLVDAMRGPYQGATVTEDAVAGIKLMYEYAGINYLRPE